MQFCVSGKPAASRVPNLSSLAHGSSVEYISLKAGDLPERSCPVRCVLSPVAIYLHIIMPRLSDVSLSTSVNFPLERSLYIGGIIRGILFGEFFFFLFISFPSYKQE